MKIAIYEVSCSNHAVMIYNWVEICKKNDWDFEIFTTKDIYKQVSSDIEVVDGQLHLLKKISLVEVIKATVNLRKCDVIVITSLQSYFLHYLPLLFLRSKFLLTIHNLNTWFVGKDFSSFKGIVKYVVRRLFLKKIKALTVNSENMKKYLDDKQFTSKLVSIVPFSLRQQSSCSLIANKNTQALNIVYPGMVSKKRKCYKDFLMLAKKNPDITFTLLGRLIIKEGGDEIEAEINDNNLKNVVYYKAFVEQEEFDKVMNSASALFSVVNVDYNHQGITEVYGETKDSGISYLMAEFAVPLIVNSDFCNFSCLNQGTFYFNNSVELDDIISRFKSSNDFLKEITNKILKSRTSLNINNVAREISGMIEKI
ncbi:MAG TPA: hypothetical protein DEO86_09615 [Colwellia sp.]|nr:hypothetical protein [Colwellia sp.]|tara:strand:+ start:5240 stop:6343 length:1104 start_codon:yes stop_codon:yes gene_type:complete